MIRTTRTAILFALILTMTVAPAQAQKKTKASKSKSSGRVKDITFDDIKFKMKKGSKFKKKMITRKIKRMDKKKIRIRGWIHPQTVFKQRGIKKFVLVRDNMECCFGPGAALYDCIIIDMAPGKSTNFTTKPIVVEGTFRIKPLKDITRKGKHLAVYAMKATKAK